METIFNHTNFLIVFDRPQFHVLIENKIFIYSV